MWFFGSRDLPEIVLAYDCPFIKSERLSGEYPAVVSGATFGNLEVPGAPLKGDSDWCRCSRVLAVVNSLAELPWIKRFIISVRAVIWAWFASMYTLILSSTMSGESLTLFSSFLPFASLSVSPVTSFSWADISNYTLESYVFPVLNVLNL